MNNVDLGHGSVDVFCEQLSYYIPTLHNIPSFPMWGMNNSFPAPVETRTTHLTALSTEEGNVSFRKAPLLFTLKWDSTSHQRSLRYDFDHFN